MISNTQGDCFAYDKTKNKCNALNELYCKKEICEFYKTKEQFIRGQRYGKKQQTYKSVQEFL